jgi:hypothetical protein
MFTKLFQWFTEAQISDIEQYITSQNPKSPADIDRIINDFNYKRQLNWF